MIEVEGLEKSFHAVHALRGVSFTAGDGEITALIGPNGAGKTTTLRILYTVLKPDRGSARVDGFDSRREPREVQRRIGVLADSRGLYPRLTAREHVRYFGRLHGLAGVALENRIDELVVMLDMGDIADRPHNVLLDEPTNGLDVAAARAIRELIRRIRDEGRCVLFSSHIMSEVEQLSDKLVVIGRGVVLANGTVADIRRRTGEQDLEEAFIRATELGDL